MPDAKSLFEAELTRRGVTFSPADTEGGYRIQTDRGELTVSLANISRDYARDREANAVIHFAEQVLRRFELPSWERARTLVYFSAEPSAHEFGKAIRYPVSQEVTKVLVLTDEDESVVTWLTPDALAEWGVTQADVESAAYENMDRLLEGKSPEVETIDEMKLGMVPVGSVFKASTIFAPGFKTFVAQGLQWPVLAVIPCRDFILVLAETDKALLNRMAAVVKREYGESGYPITTEVFEISDDGIRAIGAFPK